MMPNLTRFQPALLESAINDLGITRVRLEQSCGGTENTRDAWVERDSGAIDETERRRLRYLPVNDNKDPFTIGWQGFKFSELDFKIERVVNPMRRKMEESGQRLFVNAAYVCFRSAAVNGPYIHSNPEEYAEFVLATYLHIQEKYGWVPDAWEVINEPDNRRSGAANRLAA